MKNIRKIEFVTYKGEKWLCKIAFRLDLTKARNKIYFGKLDSEDPFSPTIYIKHYFMYFLIQIEGDIVPWIYKEYPNNQDLSFENFTRKLRKFLKVENDVLEEMRVTQFTNEDDNDLLRDIWIE